MVGEPHRGSIPAARLYRRGPAARLRGALVDAWVWTGSTISRSVRGGVRLCRFAVALSLMFAVPTTLAITFVSNVGPGRHQRESQRDLERIRLSVEALEQDQAFYRDDLQLIEFEIQSSQYQLRHSDWRRSRLDDTLMQNVDLDVDPSVFTYGDVPSAR